MRTAIEMRIAMMIVIDRRRTETRLKRGSTSMKERLGKKCSGRRMLRRMEVLRRKKFDESQKEQEGRE